MSWEGKGSKARRMQGGSCAAELGRSARHSFWPDRWATANNPKRCRRLIPHSTEKASVFCLLCLPYSLSLPIPRSYLLHACDCFLASHSWFSFPPSLSLCLCFSISLPHSLQFSPSPSLPYLRFPSLTSQLFCSELGNKTPARCSYLVEREFLCRG